MSEVEPWLADQPVSRRAFIKYGAGVVVGALIADEIVGHELYGGTNPEITTVSRESADVFPDTCTFVWPGFNVVDGYGIAASLKPSLDEYGQTAIITYAQNGLQLDDLERACVRYCHANKITRLRHYGHSMGGMLAVEFAARLQSHGISSDLIVLDCTPKDRGDVKGTAQKLGMEFMSLMSKADLNGGPLSRIALETFGKYIGGDSSLFGSLKHAIHKQTGHEVSNAVVESQARYVLQYKAADHVRHLPHTNILHLGPQNADRDHVVYDPRAIRGWNDCLKVHKQQLICRDSPETAHADPSQYPHEYNKMFRSAAIAAGLATATQLRDWRDNNNHRRLPA